MTPLFALCASVAAASGSTVGTVPSADGVPIRYEVAGQGSPAVVFVHCWTCDRHFWDHAAARLARDHRVVTLDLAGHGDSGRERSPHSWLLCGRISRPRPRDSSASTCSCRAPIPR